MKFSSICRPLGIALLFSILAGRATAQEACGNSLLLRNLERSDPQAYATLVTAQQQHTADALAQAPYASRTTAQSAVPVVFHIVVTQSQWVTMGRDTGIIRRVRSQVAVLNEDFNGQNTDQSKIPAPFKAVFGNVGLRFGLAAATNSNTIAPGVELRIVSSSSGFDPETGCAAVKTASSGLAAWDPSKYYNIWACAISGSSGGQVLGVTIPPSYVGYTLSGHTLTNADLGFVVQYNAMGRREFSAQSFYTGSDRGRTSTHETGHYFELSHTWGDDGGACPGNGGQDDGIADTPPEADATYCNKGGGNACPTFPYYDACSPSGNGVMFMNYMDYVNDTALLMFTSQQASRMRTNFQPGGQSYSLTQNPGLLSAGNAVAKSTPVFSTWPNPATETVNISWTAGEKPAQLLLTDGTGRTVDIAALSGNSAYQFDVARLPRGLYFVRVTFAEGTVVRKVVLQ